MARRLLFASLVCTLALLSASPRAAGTRFITDTDLFKFTWIADPQIAPDGSSVVFARVTANEKENRYESSLFLVSATGKEAPRRLTSNTRDTSPRWAPDGKRVAFVRAVEKDGKQQPGQIYVLEMDGGEARPLTEVPNGASAPVWSRDGKVIAFSAATEEKDTKGAQDTKESSEKKDAGYKSDVHVVTKAVYRANGNPGYVETERHAHIFTVAAIPPPSAPGAAMPAAKQITDGAF